MNEEFEPWNIEIDCSIEVAWQEAAKKKKLHGHFISAYDCFGWEMASSKKMVLQGGKQSPIFVAKEQDIRKNTIKYTDHEKKANEGKADERVGAYFAQKI